MLSSSDEKRFPVSGKNRHARPFPPPLGYGMGLTFYSWTSDQLSQYGSKFVPVSVRDAIYVLDEICNNETELPRCCRRSNSATLPSFLGNAR
jgi:TnpA family transposase